MEFNKDFALAYRLFLTAFAADPNLVPANRYNAACAALRFAAGDDIGEKLSGKQKHSLRKQAGTWLAADFALVREQSPSGQAEAQEAVAGRLRHWLADADLASVRDPKRLDELPPEERNRWQAFWDDVRAEVTKAEAKEKVKP